MGIELSFLVGKVLYLSSEIFSNKNHSVRKKGSKFASKEKGEKNFISSFINLNHYWYVALCFRKKNKLEVVFLDSLNTSCNQNA